MDDLFTTDSIFATKEQPVETSTEVIPPVETAAPVAEKPVEPKQPEPVTPAKDEPKKEEPKVGEKPTETKPVETAKPTDTTEKPAETPPEIADYLKKITDLSGGKYSFTKDDEIKDFFKKHDTISSKAEELETKFTQFETLKGLVKKYAEDNDIVKQMGGEQNYRNNFIAFELAKGRGEGALPIASSLINNMNKMSDLDALVNITKLDAPTMSTNSARRATLRELGVNISEVENWDDPMSELSEDDKALVQLKAAQKRRTIQDAINAVTIPERVDVLKQLEEEENNINNKVTEFKGKWEPAKTQLKESFKSSFAVKEFDFNIEVPESDIDSMADQFVHEISALSKEPDEATQKMVMERMQDYYMGKHWRKLLPTFGNHVKTITEKAVRAEHTNKAPVTVDETPATLDKKAENTGRLLQHMGL